MKNGRKNTRKWERRERDFQEWWNRQREKRAAEKAKEQNVREANSTDRPGEGSGDRA